MSELSTFISKAMERGYTKEEFFQILLEKGYTKSEIYSAFQDIESNNSGNEIKGSSISYWEKLKLLFSRPSGFFEIVKESNIKKSVLLIISVSVAVFLLSFGINIIFSSIFYANRIASLNSFFSLSYGLSGLFSIIFYFIYFISTFIYSGISHLVIKGFKGIGRYSDTYNTCAYSFIPFLIFTLVPVIGYLSFIYSIILMTLGFSNYHKISKGKAIIAALVPIILAIILLIIFILFILFSLRGF